MDVSVGTCACARFYTGARCRLALFSLTYEETNSRTTGSLGLSV